MVEARPQTSRAWRPATQAGTTLLELLVTTAILLILASAAMPIAAASQRREKEIRLRRALRELRLAINTYHAVCLQSTAAGGAGGQVPGADGAASSVTFRPEDDPDLTCYPKDLDVLLEGVETNIPRYKLKFLRRIPKDPFNRDGDEYDAYGWVLRSTTQRPDAVAGWDRRNVFDVSSGSQYQALDGSRYEDW